MLCFLYQLLFLMLFYSSLLICFADLLRVQCAALFQFFHVIVNNVYKAQGRVMYLHLFRFSWTIVSTWLLNMLNGIYGKLDFSVSGKPQP